ncbi:PP2C family protein-serine/threonine phosphatase [Mesobacterium pallidum]|uniref:PP2C family protein-serine/threonine phosphatase n=1 Tax=Mesobacterium pallidum TaxID=2872037 RepID=UPI001EE2FDC6|nr:SpoIIE family protein phosphatase [Mesobacterium pallidum]
MEQHKPTDSLPEPGTGSIRTVLLVDDSRLQRRILASMVARWGYDVIEAETGVDGFEKYLALRPELVISDWMMPEMDGLEFCQAVRGAGESYSYFILLTSKSEKDEIARGLDAGADDFLTKPVSADELRARITAGERILHMQKELRDKNRLIADKMAELQTLYDAIDKDLIQAKKIQQALIPDVSKVYDGSRVSLQLKPCGHVGGDLVGRFSPEPGKLGFYSIDVSGHGITSALMTARVSGYLSADFPEQNVAMRQLPDGSYSVRDAAEVALRLNERLSADVGVVEYFTMAFALVDLHTGHVEMVQAGHPHPLLIRADGTTEFVGEGGVPIGLIPGASYASVTLQLNPGDRLLLYSDGITEARLSDGEMLEPEGLVELVGRVPEDSRGVEFLDDLYWQLSQCAADAGMDDDISAVLFEFKGA